MIPLPDPPLVWPPTPDELAVERRGEARRSTASSRELAFVLRPWRLEDADALVAAWSDPEIERWTAVPPMGDLGYAERWIAGDEERRRRELSLDLVVDREGEVAGEVGLSSIDRSAGTADIGWWTVAAHRRQGVASTAAGLLVAWVSSELGLACVARCDAANPGSVAVAERAGAMVLL